MRPDQKNFAVWLLVTAGGALQTINDTCVVVDCLYSAQMNSEVFAFRLGVNLRRQIADAADRLEMKDSELVRLAIRELLRAEGFIAGPAPPPALPARKRATRGQKEPDMIGEAAG
jgi:hypothetical protein